MPTKKICYDRILPSELNAPLPDDLVEISSGNARAVFYLSKLWPNGSNIKIGFLGGTQSQQNQVKSIAPQWTNHANLTFEFADAAGAQVRIAFANDGAWSYIGTDAQQIASSQPTMNFGWLDESVVLHEFGHMIGMVHEHQNPIDNPIQWDRDAVIADLSGPPNNWDMATIEHNMFAKYDLGQINGSTFDADSIMLYSFPASWTVNGFSTDFNDSLSDLDKQFANSVYPSEQSDVVEVPVWEGTKGSIGQAGEEDLYKFTVTESATYTIETGGTTDLVMTLLDARNQTIAQDDDSGSGRNSKISSTLSPGEYIIQVRHYNKSRGTGEYTVSVIK